MNTVRVINRLLVRNAAREVREAKRAIARPSAYCMTPERAREDLEQARARLWKQIRMNPSHNRPLDLGEGEWVYFSGTGVELPLYG